MMQISEYRVTMVHDGGTFKITTTALSAARAVDVVVKAERAPRRSARLVETRPLQFERNGDDTWHPVPGEQWGRVDDHPANVDVHTNPFAPDPRNPYRRFSDTELSGHRNTLAYCVEHPETYADGTRLDESRARLAEATEEMERRGDVERAVELWERLCAVPFVRGETQGEYLHSTRHLDPSHTAARGLGALSRMPNREELEALVLSDGEETAYPAHDVVEPSGYTWRQDTSPWSGDERLYPITLTLISCGDYHGSDLDAANNRTLDGVPGVTVSTPKTGGMGSIYSVSTTVVGQMSLFANQPEENEDAAHARTVALEWLENLVNAMEGLTNYGLLDDEEHSEFVNELAEEAWQDHFENDVFDTLLDLAGSHADDEREWDEVLDGMRAEEESTPRVRTAYFGFEASEWVVNSLGEGAVNLRHDDAVKHVARTLFGWNVS